MHTIEGLAQVFKLLGDSSRLQIIFSLKDGPCSVSQIIEATGFSQPLVSFHLKLLREAGIVTTERKGTFVYNSLSDEELPKIIHQFAKYSVHAKESKHAEMPFSCACPPWMKR